MAPTTAAQLELVFSLAAGGASSRAIDAIVFGDPGLEHRVLRILRNRRAVDEASNPNLELARLRLEFVRRTTRRVEQLNELTREPTS